MTASSRIPYVLDALIALAQSAVASDVTVFDGPPFRGSAGKSLIIGVDRDGKPVSFSTEWAGVGNFARNEDFTIPCEIRVFGGNSNHKTYRDQAFTILAALENAVRATPNLGISGYTVRAEVPADGDLTQTFGGLEGGTTGPVSLLFFTVHVQTRI